MDAWEKWEEDEAPISPIHYFSWIFDVFLIVAFIGRYRTLLLLVQLLTGMLLKRSRVNKWFIFTSKYNLL